MLQRPTNASMLNGPRNRIAVNARGKITAGITPSNLIPSSLHNEKFCVKGYSKIKSYYSKSKRPNLYL